MELIDDTFNATLYADLEKDLLKLIRERLNSNGSRMGMTCLIQLEGYFSKYPNLMRIDLDFDFGYTLSYNRKLFEKILSENESGFKINFFERGMKHLGFYVIQTTNRSVREKIWKLVNNNEYVELNNARLENLKRKKVRDKEHRKENKTARPFNYKRRHV